MSSNRSFKNYVAERFSDDLYVAIEDYIEQNIDALDLRLCRVRNARDIGLSDISVKFVSVENLPGMRIEFAVAVEAEIEAHEADYHFDEAECVSEWFMVRCAGDLECSLNDFSILSISVYSGRDKQVNPMSDSLVPIIYSKDLEEAARDFLRRNYPEALVKPTAVEPQRLAENMGLRVELRNITEDCSVFGQIFFQDCKAELYDAEAGAMVTTNVMAKTILVDPDTYFLYNLGKVNNTIVHECVHWDKHRKSFALERLYNDEASLIRCETAGGMAGNTRDATEWMEWQANALAPRIQMPIAMFKAKATEYIRMFRKKLDKHELIDVMEPVIDALATFFCVSRAAAKIRMVEAGYEEAVGTFTYIDGRYVAPHRFKKGALKENQTFSIDARDAGIQSYANDKMAWTRDGSYQYVDAHFVLNHPKYIKQDESGKVMLTDYARNHMEECCIVFDMTVRAGGKKAYHSVCYLNKDKDSNISFAIKYGGGYAYADVEKQRELLKETIEEETKIYRSLPNDFYISLKMVFEWKRVMYSELGERIMVDKQTIGRIVNGKRSLRIETLVLICLGLQLPPNISRHLIRLAPCSLNMADEKHMWYDFALTYLSRQPMEYIRKFLNQYDAAL